LKQRGGKEGEHGGGGGKIGEKKMGKTIRGH